LASKVGKRFEAAFKRGMESAGAFVYRLRDCPNFGTGDGERVRYSVGNIADFFVFLYDTLFIVECKTVKGKSIRWDAVKLKNLDALIKAGEHDGVEAGILVHFRGDDTMVWVLANNWKAEMYSSTKQSFNTGDAEAFVDGWIVREGRSWLWTDWILSWLRRPLDYRGGIT
jgi:hypothetical protein